MSNNPPISVLLARLAHTLESLGLALVQGDLGLAEQYLSEAESYTRALKEAI